MRFDRLRLLNFKPYADVDVQLGDGVTVIHGLNGSGKSSLLEACFFALYGSKALEETLEDVVTTGAEEAEIELEFTHDGADYRIERRLRATGERTTTAACILETPEGTLEGARNVRRRVTELLRMDAEAFVNCAYVRQGEVNKLINATPAQRQDVIDDLLQLGKLEEYRDRANRARLGVEDVLGDRRGRLSQLEAQIESKETEEPHERLNALESELDAVAADVERYEGQREKAVRTKQEAREVLDGYEETRDELDRLGDEIEAIEAEIAGSESEREELREQIRERRERGEELDEEVASILDGTAVEEATDDAVVARLDELESRVESLRADRSDVEDEATAYANQADRLAEKADDLESRAADERERAAALDEAVETAREELDNRRERLDEVDAEIDDLEERFEAAPVAVGEATDHRKARREELSDLRDDLAEARAEVERLEDEIEGAETLLAEGKCPECGQNVEGSPHVDALDETRERLDEAESDLARLREEREAAETALEAADALVEVENRLEGLRENRRPLEGRIEDKRAEIDEKSDEATARREEAADLESSVEECREAAAEKREQAGSKRESAADLGADIEAAEERRERLRTVRERLSDLEALEADVDRLRERRANLAELNDERRDRLAEKRERRSDLREAVDESQIEEARADEARAEDYVERVETELERLEERRSDLQGRIGGVRQDLRQLESLREEQESVAARVEALESLREEAEELAAMYGDLRSELRQRNVQSLERMLNETFDLVYGNDAYSKLRLDGEYELTVFQKDGTALDPKQLSGGERALFNLSLRCAIYRLLAEGIEGTAPMPPLILDEPTVFLDAGHVSRLVDLVEEMRDLGVRQIVIVSHDEELVGAADDLIRVEKDPTTNRSSVRRATTPDTIDVEADD